MGNARPVGRGHLLAGLICIITLFAGATASPAAGLFEQATSGDVARAGARTISPRSADPGVMRYRYVRIKQVELGQHLAPLGIDQSPQRLDRARSLDGAVTLELFPGTIATFQRADITAKPDGGYVWEGKHASEEFWDAVLIIENGGVYGRVQLAHKVFRISHIGGALHLISELDPGRYPDEAAPLRPENAPPDRPTGQRGQTGEGTQDQVPPPGSSQTRVIPPPGVPVRVLVAYTPAAVTKAQAIGSTVAAQINKAIALANTAYSRGAIPIYLELVGTMQVSYTETSAITPGLNALTSGSTFAAVRTQRVTVKADVVTLLVGNATDACGIAWLPVTSPFSNMPMPGPASRAKAYSVVQVTCVDNLSFHHELGHNMGLEHDRFAVGGTPSNTRYNYGYVNLAKRARSVMAYNNQCGSINCTRINWFSSPTVKATNGVDTNVLLGVAQNSSGAADNTRRLKETAVLVASYSPWPVQSTARVLNPPTNYNSISAANVNADGSVVVGNLSPLRAFRWTKAGTVVLPDLGGNNSQATGVSADGSVVVGYSFPSSGYVRAVRWITSNGDWTRARIQPLNLLPNHIANEATAVSADGSVVVGVSYDAAQMAQTFRATATSVVELRPLAGHVASRPTGVSADGSVVIGFSIPSSGPNIAVRWTPAGSDWVRANIQTLRPLPGHTVSYANAVSADGSVVVGSSWNPDGVSLSQSVRWTPASASPQNLGISGSSSTSSVSADGSIVVGISCPTSACEAYRWTSSTGMQSINARLLYYPSPHISADGSTFVGAGSSGKAFIGTLPLPSL